MNISLSLRYYQQIGAQVAGVLQPFEREAARHRAIANDSDNFILFLLYVPGGRETESGRY